MNNIYLDTETSGLKPGQIGQLALIEESADNIKGYNYFFKMKSITQGAADVTHRNLEFYEKESLGHEFKTDALEISKILNGNRLIAHNFKFDESFLSIEFFRCNIPFNVQASFCTMEFFKDIMKIPGKKEGTYKNPKLIEVISWLHLNEEEISNYTKELFNLNSNNFHDAMFDTTSMFVACKVFNDSQLGTRYWSDRFVLK